MGIASITGVLKKIISGTGMRLSVGTVSGLRFTYTLDQPPVSGSTPANPAISLSTAPNMLLQVGDASAGYWIMQNIWGAGTLVSGTYTTISGSTYEQYIGRALTNGSLGSVAMRVMWKFPIGSTEIKSYPAIQNGRRPGFSDAGALPAGMLVINQADATIDTFPSGATPGNWMPLGFTASLAPIYSTGNFEYSVNGRGHLSYDIWVQNTADQCHGFNNCSELEHEIMIPLRYWGGYGSYPDNRNWAAWSAGDVTISGITWHIFHQSKGDVGAFNPWSFTVFEPDTATVVPASFSLDLAQFLNYCRFTRGWISASFYLTSIELGVETVEGEGDLKLYNYRTHL